MPYVFSSMEEMIDMQEKCRNVLTVGAMMVVVSLSGYAADADPHKTAEAWKRMISSPSAMPLAGRQGEIVIHNNLTQPITAHVAGKNLCKASVKSGWADFEIVTSEAITINAGKKAGLVYYARRTGGVKSRMKVPLTSNEMVQVNDASQYEVNMVAPKLIWQIAGESTANSEDLSEAYKRAYNMDVSIGSTVKLTLEMDKEWSNWSRVSLARKHLARLIEAKRGVGAPKEIVDALQAHYDDYFKKSQPQFAWKFFQKRLEAFPSK